MKKLYVIYGGPSSEREVSFASKDYFVSLYKNKNPILVEWLPNFDYKVFSLIKQVSKDSFVGVKQVKYSEKEFYKKLASESCVALIAGHGEYIEDGYLQKKFESFGIKYTGSSSGACKLAMDKYKSQKIASKFIKTIPTYKSKLSNFNAAKLLKVVGDYNIFIKPNNLGSSVGCFVIKNKLELNKLLPKLNKNYTYLFQKNIKGVELSLGSVRYGNAFLPLKPTEIRPKVSKFFNWEAKYSKGGSNEITPATLGSAINNKVISATNKIHNALGLGFYSRSDYIVDTNKNIYYLETNTYPGMSKTSLLPQQLNQALVVDKFKVGLLNNLV